VSPRSSGKLADVSSKCTPSTQEGPTRVQAILRATATRRLTPMLKANVRTLALRRDSSFHQ
jgi:hypothetical protein